MVGQKVRLKLDGFDRKDTFKGKFYNKLKVFELIAESKLVSVSILLGKGLATEKAEVLFDDWDTNGNFVLETTEMTNSID